MQEADWQKKFLKTAVQKLPQVFSMPADNITILSTRWPEELLQQEAAEYGIMLDAIPFITTEPVEETVLSKKTEPWLNKEVNVVFTSRHAVESLSRILDRFPESWTCYCLSGATQNTVRKTWPGVTISGTAENANLLASQLGKISGNNEVLFFCGNLRRNELPEVLKGYNKNVVEITCYETQLTPVITERRYHGILFMSPSAVKSFFSVNNLPDETAIFAIGNTTAAEIKKITRHEPVISETPATGPLMQKIAEYFNADKKNT
jgi:uroporphyrinogen-III synthase